MLENMLEKFWFHSPPVLKKLLVKVGYELCEALCGFVPNTTVSIQVSSDSIAAYTLLDMDRVRQEPNLPTAIQGAVSATGHDWNAIVSGAHLSMALIEMELEKPEWRHLRKTPS